MQQADLTPRCLGSLSRPGLRAPPVGRARPDGSAPRAGLVFGAFALNLVDCGGLLGGRLGDRPRAQLKPARAARSASPAARAAKRPSDRCCSSKPGARAPLGTLCASC